MSDDNPGCVVLSVEDLLENFLLLPQDKEGLDKIMATEFLDSIKNLDTVKKVEEIDPFVLFENGFKRGITHVCEIFFKLIKDGHADFKKISPRLFKNLQKAMKKKVKQSLNKA